MYEGSSSSPPCKENVLYIVYDKPVEISFDDIITVSDFISEMIGDSGNNRTTQPIGKRLIYYFKKNDEEKFKNLVDLKEDSIESNISFLRTGTNDIDSDDSISSSLQIKEEKDNEYVKKLFSLLNERSINLNKP